MLYNQSFGWIIRLFFNILAVDNDLNTPNSFYALQLRGDSSLVVGEEIGLELSKGLLKFEEIGIAIEVVSD